VRQHDGVVVRVDDPRGRDDRLGHLVHVRFGRDARADVGELPDARLGRRPLRIPQPRRRRLGPRPAVRARTPLPPDRDPRQRPARLSALPQGSPRRHPARHRPARHHPGRPPRQRHDHVQHQRPGPLRPPRTLPT
jgi:hypothetical protein